MRDRTTAVWAVLVAATVLTGLIGLESHTRVLAGVCVIAIGFAKLRLVGIHFMELGRAPRPLRLIFEAYVAVCGGAVLALFLVA